MGHLGICRPWDKQAAHDRRVMARHRYTTSYEQPQGSNHTTPACRTSKTSHNRASTTVFHSLCSPLAWQGPRHLLQETERSLRDTASQESSHSSPSEYCSH